MNMKRFYYLMVLACLTLCVLVSCEKNNYDSYPPTWKGFEVTNAEGVALSGKHPVVNPGQKIIVRAVQAEKGHLINATNYYWKLIVSRGTAGKDTINGDPYPFHTNYDGTSSDDPVMTFIIPSDAKIDTFAMVQFDATYTYSGNGIQVADGKSYDDPTISGSIRSTSGTLWGGAKGTTTLSVK